MLTIQALDVKWLFEIDRPTQTLGVQYSMTLLFLEMFSDGCR